jgi:hypothetical protein
MAEPHKKPEDRVKNNRGNRDPIKRMIGTPEPTLQYMEGMLGRLFTPGVMTVLAVVLVLYFVLGH